MTKSGNCDYLTMGFHIPDLFTDQIRLPHVCATLPFSEEKFPQERVQRFLLTAELLTTATVLLTESTEEPLEDEEGPLRGVGFLGWCDENDGVFGPVGRIFGKGSRR